MLQIGYEGGDRLFQMSGHGITVWEVVGKPFLLQTLDIQAIAGKRGVHIFHFSMRLPLNIFLKMFI